MRMTRITANPRILGGKAIIRGTRITVQLILDLLAAGETTETILREYYTHLAPEDVRACLEYAARISANEISIDMERTA